MRCLSIYGDYTAKEELTEIGRVVVRELYSRSSAV